MTEERDQKHTFQYLSQNTARLILSALLCCALWGSAFPCVKIGYELLAIADTGSQILFAGYRFFLAGVLTFLLGSLMERRLLRIRRSSLPAVIGQGFADHRPVRVFLHRAGPHERFQGIGHQCFQRLFHDFLRSFLPEK